MAQQVRSQLQMMLLQQSGPASLPLSNLAPDQFLGFLRKVERTVLDERLAPTLAYWSSQNAQRLLPAEHALRELKRDSFCVSVFSESRLELADEWCFLMESQRMSMIVYGQQDLEQTSGIVFQCNGSLDPAVVRQAFNKMLPIWQFIDLSESNRLEDARSNVGQTGSTPQLMQWARGEWDVFRPVTSEMPAPTLPPPSPPEEPVSSEPAFFASSAPVAAELQTLPALPKLPMPGMMTPAQEEQLAAQVSEAGLPIEAQEIIRSIIQQLRQSSDLSQILQMSVEKLTQATNADRGLIWQIEGDELAVTNEYSRQDHHCFIGNQLSQEESTAIVLEFIQRFPSDSGSGVIAIPDTMHDQKLRKISPTLTSLTELGDVRAKLIAQLRCRGEIRGFVEIQQCSRTREWSNQDAAVVQAVTEMLSVVVAQAFDQTKMKSDAQEMKLLNEIANLFRESRGLKGRDMLVKSARLVAEHIGFENCQIYLYNADDGGLIPNIGDEREPVELDAKDNPFVTVYETGKGKMINAEFSRRGDPYFEHETALVVPLISEGERLGVLGLWSRLPNRPQLNPQDKDLALNIAGQLANIVRADQAITQIRADQAREALINHVSEEIKQSLKEADEILETFVEALREHLDLSLTVVTLYDVEEQKFTKSKVRSDGTLGQEFDAPGFCEQLFNASMVQLKEDNNVFMQPEQISEALGGIPCDPIKSATLVPLIHAGNFKGALCMVSCDRQRPYGEKDMKMVNDLADRVAVVISHAELFAQVERQAVTDPMTGLYNRRYFNEQLTKEIDRFQRFGRPFSYIIIDLDYLKKINDTLGHQYGDAAIKHIAAVLKKKVRDVDTAARYGGEEFVLLLPETDTKAAKQAGERFCAAIRENPVEGIGVITASVGVSTFPVDASDREKLTETADQALYLAKHRGRNQVCSVSEDLIPSLQERGEEALEVQQHAIKQKAEEMASIDLKLIAEHGILGIMGAIIKIIEARDAYTKDRSPKAAEYATKLAQALHLSKDHQTIISLAAILNNVGKIALPEEVLQKPGPLTEEERKLIETSPTLGAKILEPAKHLQRVATVIEAYHEHYDGTGYPKHLKAEQIPLESRIICLIDSYIAMISDRPYRKALSHEEAVQQIRDGAGKEFDPRLVKLFLSILEKEAPTASRK